MFTIVGIVQYDLFAQFTRLLINVRVSWEPSRVQDGYVETLGDGMVQEDAVHGISQPVQASDREGTIAQAT